MAAEQTDIKLDFKGPFTFNRSGNYLFESQFAKSPGIYLWTIKQRNNKSHLIHYVGETVSFAKRQKEHLIHILGMNYGIFDPEKAQDGICEIVWPGLWRKRSSKGPCQLLDSYQSNHNTVIEYITILNVFFAEIDIETHLRRHIEGCIGWNLRNNHPEDKILYPDDNHVGTKKEKDIGQLFVSSDEYIRGLDSVIAY
jgi:hypothetical protein